MLEEEKKEAVELLRRLIRFDTTNPPGNETPAAQFLKEEFDREGIFCEVVESQPGRGSFLAALDGGGGKPTLLLFSHLDVVPATAPESWKHPPFSGDLDDGWIWGRGAVDTKYLTAAETMAMILLRRQNIKLKGSLRLVAVADEERGSTFGTRWLVDNHPDKVRADYVINEGGGFVAKTRKGPVYLVEVEEKGICLIKMTTRGVAKHASVPELGVSAVARMSEALAKIAQHRTKIRPSPALRKMLQTLDGYGYFKTKNVAKRLLNPKTEKATLDQIRKRDPVAASTISALLRPTIAETMIKGGVKENVIPDHCEAIIDTRLPQGVTKEDILRELRRVVGPMKGVEFEVIQYKPTSSSPTDNPFYQAIGTALTHTVGGSVGLSPFVVTGATDSSYLRPLGSIAYGFGPTSSDVEYNQLFGLVHAIDERINVQSLYTCTDFLVELCKNTLS